MAPGIFALNRVIPRKPDQGSTTSLLKLSLKGYCRSHA